MIRLDETRFEEIYKIMVEAFPIEERRSEQAQFALFQNPAYEVYGCIQEGKVCAFITIWKMSSVHFVEHLAVDHTMRGTGIGNVLLKEYKATTNLPILLEVEKPENTIAKRRINFYERIGFYLYDAIPYVQPAFHEGMKDLPLHIMMNQKRKQEDVISIINDVYQCVYKREYI